MRAWRLPAAAWLAFAVHPAAAAPPPADPIHHSGTVYTADARDSMQQAVAIRDGCIVFVGTDEGARRYAGRGTRAVDVRGRMVMPGLVDGHAYWGAGSERGRVYIRQDLREELISGLARQGIEPHIHAIGDRAVKFSLDAIQKVRASGGAPADYRPAIAHAELVDPVDYERFRTVGVVPVMSYQWSIPGPNSVTGARDHLGPERFERMEPFCKLLDRGVRVAHGSDWPVDRLDYWLALKGGITRSGRRDVPRAFAGRLNRALGLTRMAALRSITIDGAWALHQESETGSIEVGKLADLIVLERNFLTVPDEELAENKVLLTLVGGTAVHNVGILP
jgi:predicted amidohydrolase YtcJ